MSMRNFFALFGEFNFAYAVFLPKMNFLLTCVLCCYSMFDVLISLI